MDLDAAILALARALDRGQPVAELQARVWSEVLDHPMGIPAGEAYQALQSRVLERTESGDLVVRRQRRLHRATGAYYTVPAVTGYMARRVREFMPGAASLLDPACGDGALLEAAARAFGPQAALHGVDRDPAAVALARDRLAGAPAGPAVLTVADALLDDLPGGFDVVLGNPPYISHGLRGAPGADRAWEARLRQRYPASAQYKLNTYPLFVERGLELLRPGGVLGFVLPDSFLAGRYFAGLRRLLLRHTLLEITLIQADFWPHGRVGQTVLLFVRKADPPASHAVTLRISKVVDDLTTQPAVTIPQVNLAWGETHRFRLLTDPEARLLVETMDATPGALPLGRLVRTYSGLIGRKGQASLLRSAHPEHPGPWAPLLRSGREIDRYTLHWAGEELCLDPSLFKSGGKLEYYRQPKILLRQTADSLRAVLDTAGHFCLNNMHLLVPRTPEVPLPVLEAFLNAEPLNRYYRALTLETGRLYAQVDLDLLAELPIPPLAPFTDRLSALVAQRKGAAPAEAAPIERAMDAIVGEAYGLPPYLFRIR